MKIKIETSDGYYFTSDINQTDSAIAAETIQRTLGTTHAQQVAKEKEELKTHFKTLLDSEIDKLTGSSAQAVNSGSQGITTSGDATLDEIFEEAAKKYGVEKRLLLAVAKQESDFDVNSTSGAGAMGVMQLIQSTADELGVKDPYDPYQNIMGGAKYLKQLLDRYNGNKELALAAYNAGWPAVDKYGGIPPYEETQNYVPLVMGYYENGVSAPDDTKYSTGKSSTQAASSSKMSRDEAYAILMQGLNNAIKKLS